MLTEKAQVSQGGRNLISVPPDEDKEKPPESLKKDSLGVCC